MISSVLSSVWRVFRDTFLSERVDRVLRVSMGRVETLVDRSLTVPKLFDRNTRFPASPCPESIYLVWMYDSGGTRRMRLVSESEMHGRHDEASMLDLLRATRNTCPFSQTVSCVEIDGCDPIATPDFISDLERVCPTAMDLSAAFAGVPWKTVVVYDEDLDERTCRGVDSVVRAC